MVKNPTPPMVWRLLVVVFLPVSLVAVLELLPAARTTQVGSTPRRVNAPYFPGEVRWAESAIFWFGKNEQGVPSRNYADVRVAYTAESLRVYFTVVDYYLWYRADPAASDDLTQYDALSLYLDTNHDRAAKPQPDDYLFLVGARHWPNDNAPQYHRQARGSGGGWDMGWTGDWSESVAMQWYCNPGPNSNECGIDYGWTARFTIPWESLGHSESPPKGTVWGLGVLLHDRDDEPPAGYVEPQPWPEAFDADSPVTWGELRFGYADPQPLRASPEGATRIRAASTEDNTVEDAWMGGGGTCSGGHEGGSEVNHGDESALFIGTETAPTHFPCFNKSYLRFSLNSIAPGKVILSATLTLHVWGNAGDPGQAQPSWVHVFTISDPWDEMTIHWNNAPLAQQNVSAAWVYPYSNPGSVEFPGDAHHWDVTQAVAEAYAEGRSLSLALYGSDTAQHSSKYLTSSETGDWNAEGRPTVNVTWGSAAGTLEKLASPPIVMPGDAITYNLTLLGSGQALTLTDDLPAGVSTPLALSPGLTYTPHRVSWGGMPNEGEQVTLTYVVTVAASSDGTLWNQALLVQADGSTETAAAAVLVNPVQVYLPLSVRGR